MAAKTTASYRIPVVSSSYHEKCIAPSVKAIKEVAERTASDKTFSYAEYRKCNAVAQERIWSEHCQKEHRTAKSWQRDWKFLTEYDYKGNPKPKKELPKKISFYGNSSIPHTTSKQFGLKVIGTRSREMGRLEMTTCYRKTRTDVAQYGTQ